VFGVFQKLMLVGLIVWDVRTVMGQEPLIQNEVVHSRRLGADRAIHVYLPASYKTETQRRYPVLYLHDGQNVFSTAGTNNAFGWGSWQLDKTADELARAQKMQEVIMVAVDNSTNRLEEYDGRVSSPQAGAAPTNAPTAFENYAAFLITELKPQIDREYRTKPDPANTGVMGSSLGGICSVVLAWEHPEIFGRAACLSGSFQIEHTNFLNEVLHDYHSKPKPFRIYLDSGTMDFTGGDDNCALTAQVAAELRRIGWENDIMLYVDEQPLTPEDMEKAGLRRGKWAEAQTSRHNEFYWRLRAWRALMFLFPPGVK
jgi:predicted alpha/beta superfamily hydrolase